MNGATIFSKSLQQNNWFLGCGGHSKIWLLQFYVVFWILVIDAICKFIEISCRRDVAIKNEYSFILLLGDRILVWFFFVFKNAGTSF